MLELEDVRLGYGKMRVVNGVSLSLKDGGRLAVLGRNGVGKTTLLKGVVGLLPLSGGSVCFRGRDVSSLRPHLRCRMGMAYVPQGREILPWFTVRENLELGCLDEKDGDRTARRMERILEWFPVLKGQLGRAGGLLSGGQQQQLAVARALMTAPRLLILDEPTEGIQPNIVEGFGRVLRRICAETGLSVLLVEQNLGFARKMAENFLILQKGKAVCSGRMEQLDEQTVRRFLSV